MQQTPPPRSLDGVSSKQPNQTQNTPIGSPPPLDSVSPLGPESFSPPPAVSEAVMPPPTTKKSAPRKKWKRWQRVTAVLSLTVLIAVAGAGMLFWYLRHNIIVDNLSGGAASLQEGVDPNLLRGEGDGRVNALLIGIDDAAGLADSIMLVSFDPIAKDVVMLSVPRDLYVDMGDFGSAKINAAHAYGEQYDYPGGGPGLLKDTLSRALDVPIHYYGRLDFDGFRRAIDTVGGVTVDVSESLIDPYYPDGYGGYTTLRVDAGAQVMDGQTALRFARSRYTTSDFDRSRRQQEIMMALKEQVFSAGTLSNPNKITQLLSTLGNNAQTDMKISEMMRLVELSEGVTESNITQAQLDASEDNFLSFSNIYGQSALVPTAGDFSAIQEYVRTLMVDSYIKDEAARVSILNGTEVPGLANQKADLLRSYGYRVVNVDNASDQNYAQTVIFNYNSDNPYTLRYLEKRFGVRAQRRQAPSQGSDYDIEIVLGNNYDSAP